MEDANNFRKGENLEMGNSLREKIIGIIERELNIKFTDKVDYQCSLLDPRIGLKPRDLLVIFFSLQNGFHITFSDKDILERRFDFLENIVIAVQEKLETVA